MVPDATIRLVLRVTLALVLTLSSVVSAFDVDAFEQLAQRERIAVIVGCLQQRDAEMSNFSYEYTELIGTVQKDGKRSAGSRSLFSLKRLDASNLLHVVRFSLPGKKYAEFWSSWDGKVQRSFTLAQLSNGKEQRSGRIADSEVKYVSETWFNQLLGYRVHGLSITLADWLSERAAKGEPIEVGVIRDPAGTFVTIRVSDEFGAHSTHWINPSRGFMIVKSGYLLTRPDYRLDVRFEATQARQVDGVWMPMAAVRTNQISNKGEYRSGEWTYEVTACSVNSVKPADLEVRFPEGSTVSDSVKRSVYTIGKDGKETPVAFFDAATGKVVEPTAQTQPSTAPSVLPQTEVKR